MNVSGTPPFRASVDLRTPLKDSCPPQTVWHELMTEVPGDAPSGSLDERTAALLTHASNCPDCGQLLARAIENSPGIPDAEEAAWLENLPSSTPAGQRRLAETMQRVAAGERRPASRFAPQPGRSWSGSWFGWQTFAFVGAAAVAVVCAYVWLVPHTSPDAQLLALAYDQHRLTELRLGDGHAVALESPTRGADTDVSSSHLLKVKLRAQQRMEENPNDAEVRQTLGRIALVEHDGAAAVRDFEMAQALAPGLAGLNRDLASAYFELAETTGQSTDYARSIDFFGKHLQQVGGKDAAALYNRGLAWERQAVYTEAIKDYEAALAQEKDAGWRAEIARHLQAARAHASDYGHPGPASGALTPASLLARKGESAGDYELYLLIASRKWLPQRGRDAESAAALEKLAEWGNRHHDSWLAEMLRTAPAEKETEAETVLARALDASNIGEADIAMEAATTASSLFKALGNKAGMARADAEVVYSQHRRSHASDCLQRAHALEEAHALDRYSTVRLYVALEVSSCLAMQQDPPGSMAVVNKAAEAAREDGLSITLLRALGFAAQIDNNIDESALAWKTGVQGLFEAEQIGPAVMRRYQLLYSLKVTAAKLGLLWTAAGLSEAAATTASRSESLQTHAYALEQLGLDQAKTGQEAEAIATFGAADKVLAMLPEGPTKTHYFADWATDRAPFRARRAQDLPVVLDEFRSAEHSYQGLDSYGTRLDYYMEYAELLLKANRTDDALGKGWYAVQQAEISQGNASTMTAKQGAAEIASRAYLSVVRAYLQQGRPEDALRAWMWFQAAPYRAAAYTSGAPQELAAQLPSLPVTDPGRLTLVFARVDGSYIAWALAQGKLLRTHTVTVPAEQAEERGAVLLRLCADPKSSPRDLAVLGEGLYADLLAPFDDLLKQASVVQLALDPALAGVPFAALQHHGNYFGLERPLLFYSAGWSMAGPRVRQAITDQERLSSASRLLVLQQAPHTGQVVIPGVYDESAEVAKAFAHAEQRQASVWRNGTDLLLAGDAALPSSLPQADLLHYTGHGLSTPGASGTKPAGTFALEPHSLPHCRLAVLAACQSLHERENIGNDVPSFARILLRAGASHVLATQWDVDSRSTRELMVRFYAELADHQTSPQALLRAQQFLYQHAGSAHPYFWSPFQIVAQ